MQLSDFKTILTPTQYSILNVENLSCADLLSHLDILRFLPFNDIARIVQQVKGYKLVKLTERNSHPKYQILASKYCVNIQQSANRTIQVFIPYSCAFNIPQFELDLVNHSKYPVEYFRTLPEDPTLRPLLVIRSLILDCINHEGTNMQIISDGPSSCEIYYRVKGTFIPSTFKLSKTLLEDGIQQLIAHLTTSSAADLSLLSGLTASVTDILLDGSTDLRVTVCNTHNGYYCDMAIQKLSGRAMELTELGFPQEDQQKLFYIFNKTTGLTLNTGEQRSGKNTTMLAGIKYKLSKEPIRVIEYADPIETLMPYPQIDYKGDIPSLTTLMSRAKKMAIDVALLNEIPSRDIAFAVKDLVNSAIGVITTLHLDRIWFLPYKMEEYFGESYRGMFSQLNAVVNHKMFKCITSPIKMKTLVNPDTPFLKFAQSLGVKQYPIPITPQATFDLQPIVEILVFNKELRYSLQRATSLSDIEETIRSLVESQGETFEHKLVAGINNGVFLLDELYKLY